MLALHDQRGQESYQHRGWCELLVTGVDAATRFTAIGSIASCRVAQVRGLRSCESWCGLACAHGLMAGRFCIVSCSQVLRALPGRRVLVLQR